MAELIEGGVIDRKRETIALILRPCTDAELEAFVKWFFDINEHVENEDDEDSDDE